MQNNQLDYQISQVHRETVKLAKAHLTAETSDSKALSWLKHDIAVGYLSTRTFGE